MIFYLIDQGKIPEKWRISWSGAVARAIFAIIGGLIAALAYPPIGFPFAILVAPAMLLLLCYRSRVRQALLYGFLWGTAWSLVSFWWLREIDPVIPFLMAPTLGIFCAIFAVCIPIFSDWILLPRETLLAGHQERINFRQFGFCRQFTLVMALAAAWVLIFEYSRSYMFPWNYISSAWYRYPEILGLARISGTWGISFVVVSVSFAGALAVIWRKYLNFVVVGSLGVLILLLPGLFYTSPSPEGYTGKIGLIQGDISQRRSPKPGQAEEALQIYLQLTRELLQSDKAEIVVWPESAIPIAYRSTYSFSKEYRNQVQKLVTANQISLLFGTIDFTQNSPGIKDSQGVTNSALLVNSSGQVVGKFDKIHRVPFGEYIPFRQYFPESLVNYIDMGRDLSPGVDFSPLKLNEHIRAGMMICFEDVFSYVPRQAVLRSANLLLTITNDAWYPNSSEPEQHLANSVMRAIESDRYFVRVGNNSGTCVITPTGKITHQLEVAGTGPLEIRRGRGIQSVSDIPLIDSLTFYTRFGDWFIGLCFIIIVGAIIYIAGKFISYRRYFADCCEQCQSNNTKNKLTG